MPPRTSARLAAKHTTLLPFPKGAVAASQSKPSPQAYAAGIMKHLMQTAAKSVPTYSQATDPSLTGYMKAGQTFVGETAMRAQIAGHTGIAADHVRADARAQPNHRSNVGLHEGLPTSLANDRTGDETQAGIMSGLRSYTSQTALVSPQEVSPGAHSGMFPLAGPGSAFTGGQKHAHDVLRQPLNGTASQKVSQQSSRFLQTLANGQQLMQGTRMDSTTLPNYTPLDPTGHGVGGANSAARIPMAQVLHRGREKTKDRLTTWETANGLPRSSTPERTDIDAHGGGGSYKPGSAARRARSPLPKMAGKGPGEQVANTTAWISQHMRAR